MPAKKTKRVSKNKKGGADTTIDSSKISSINNFTSTRTTSPVNLTGSIPKSSEGFKAPSSTTSGSLFSSSPNKSRLMSMPVSAAASAAAAMSSSQGKGVKIFKYIIVFFVLAFLFLTLYLYLEKPKTTDISHLYDPVTKFFVNSEKKKPESGVNKLAKTLDEKKVVNNIDKSTGASATGTSSTGTGATNNPILKEKKYKKKPVIPQADDATSMTQMKPKSKAGFCYIGEDRGFRSCIEVGEGDVCMSGDIFPTRAICINPNLRE